MNLLAKNLRKYNLGLIGYPLDHSFSKDYFEQKFLQNKIDNFTYNLFPLNDISLLEKLINKKNLIGFNVTSPHKSNILNHLDSLGEIANKTKTVNTVFISPKKQKIGFNTDYVGFETLIKKINKNIKSALILGSGGVSKTISAVFDKKQIKYNIVSRTPTQNKNISYFEANKVIGQRELIINTTPLGQFPKLNECPKINFESITKDHICIDLVYNPAKTLFLKKCGKKNATIINGLEMLKRQADEAWKIWLNLINKEYV